MIKKISAIKARQNFGQLMNEVALRGDDYIVERSGKPMVAIVSLEKFRILELNRETASEALDTIWNKMKDEDPETVSKTINEAIKAAKTV